MGCLHFHSSFLPQHSQLNNKQVLKAKEQLWLFCGASRLGFQEQKVGVSVVPLRTNAISNSIFVAAKIPPSQSGDIKVFLQTSVLLLVVYFLANFVAPYFISKFYGFDKVGEDQNANDNDK